MKLIHPDAAHQQRVGDLARQVRDRPAGRRLTRAKNTPTHSVHERRYKADCTAVDVSPLNHILAIDAASNTATVEGQVQLGALCQATMAYGLLPAVVPEYRDFTVAGLINGEGIQSSSHRYGVFSHTKRVLEIVLGDGSTIVASEEQNADLFHIVGGSMGTMGFVTAATLRLIEAKPFVRSVYRRFRTLDVYVAALMEALEQTTYLEGVIFGPDCYVLITAEFVDDPRQLPVFAPLAPGRPYYYQHVKSAAEGHAPTEDAMATLDYLARSERGGWWMVECMAGVPFLTGTFRGRLLVDKQNDAKKSARDRFEPGPTGVFERERCIVLQDIGFRIERLPEAIRWAQNRLDLYPIWNCPIHLRDHEVATFRTHHLVDVGLYGEPRVPGYQPVSAMRELQRMSDVPSLWGVSYLTIDELRSVSFIDFDAYHRLRHEYAAEDAFLSSEEKVVWVDPAKPLAGKPRMWRLRLFYGRRWYVKPQALWALLAGTWANWVWSAAQALATILKRI
jgi:FAD/FMN-containing dehydrogenase